MTDLAIRSNKFSTIQIIAAVIVRIRLQQEAIRQVQVHQEAVPVVHQEAVVAEAVAGQLVQAEVAINSKK